MLLPSPFSIIPTVSNKLAVGLQKIFIFAPIAVLFKCLFLTRCTENTTRDRRPDFKSSYNSEGPSKLLRLSNHQFSFSANEVKYPIYFKEIKEYVGYLLNFKG